MAEQQNTLNTQKIQYPLKEKMFNENTVVIVEDKQASDLERLQYQNDLSSLYSSQKQAYNFQNIGNLNNDEYIQTMINSKSSKFNQNQKQQSEKRKNGLRNSATINFDEKNPAQQSEYEIFQIIKESQKKNTWQQISDNILTPFAPKFLGMYDNTKFIPEELLNMDKEAELEKTPYSEDKDINWDQSDYNSDDVDSLDQKNVHHTISLVTSPLLKKKTRTENNDNTLYRAQLQEPFLHTKLIKQITENLDPQHRKSESSPRRFKSPTSKSLYSKVSFAELNKSASQSINSTQKNFMRKVRFEHLPHNLKEQLNHEEGDQTVNQYQVISQKKRANKIYLDKVLVILENQDQNVLQKIYIPKVKDKVNIVESSRKRIFSATSNKHSREFKKKILNLQRNSKKDEALNNQDNEIQKYIRRRSCCCEECGGVNSKLERIKDLVLEKDIPIIPQKPKKSPDTRQSNLSSPLSSKSNKSPFESRFSRKKNLTTKIAVVHQSSSSQHEIPKTSGSSHNASLTKIPSLNESQTFKNAHEKKSSNYESFKDSIHEDASPLKKRNGKKVNTSLPFNSLQKAPSFKTLRQEREVKVFKQQEQADPDSKDRSKDEEDDLRKNSNPTSSQQNTIYNSQNRNSLLEISEGAEIKQDRNQDIKQFKINHDSQQSITYINAEYDFKSRRESGNIDTDQKESQKNILTVLNKIQQQNNPSRQVRSKSEQTMRQFKRCESVNTEINNEGGQQNKQTNSDLQKQRSLNSFNNFLIRQQLQSRNRSERSLPNILNKKGLIEKNYKQNDNSKIKNKDLMNYVNCDKYDTIQEILNRKNNKYTKKGSGTDRFQVYQHPHELVLKTKQQIIAESYKQMFDNTKKLINNQKLLPRQSQDFYITKRSSNNLRLNTNYDQFNTSNTDKFPEQTEQSGQDINQKQAVDRKKSRSSNRKAIKKDSFKENMDKLKSVYDI